MILNDIARGLAPPVLVRGLRALKQTFSDDHSFEISFNGNYKSWADAIRNSDGYGGAHIFNRVRESTAKVRDGIAAAERDGFAFAAPQWNFPLNACLSRIALGNGGDLTVLDFGGSLGGTFFQCRDFFAGTLNLNWNIVEQA